MTTLRTLPDQDASTALQPSNGDALNQPDEWWKKGKMWGTAFSIPSWLGIDGGKERAAKTVSLWAFDVGATKDRRPKCSNWTKSDTDRNHMASFYHLCPKLHTGLLRMSSTTHKVSLICPLGSGAQWGSTLKDSQLSTKDDEVGSTSGKSHRRAGDGRLRKPSSHREQARRRTQTNVVSPNNGP